MVLPPYAKWPSSSPRLTVEPLFAPVVQTMLPTCRNTISDDPHMIHDWVRTSMAPIATNAMGVPVAVCVIWSTDRLLAVNTSKPGSLTACGFTVALELAYNKV